MLRERMVRAIAAVLFLWVVVAAGTLEVTWAQKVARAAAVSSR
jgi:hypothetical protein